MIKPTVLLFLCGTSLSFQIGCFSPPTREQMVFANYGIKPSQAHAESVAEKVVRSRLKDPESARFSWSPLEQGWFVGARKRTTRFAWRLYGTVNAKNSYGGYAGRTPWCFYFRGNRAVGIGKWFEFDSDMIDDRLVYTEVDGVDWNDGDQSTQAQNRRDRSAELPAATRKSRAAESSWLRLRRGLDERAVRDLLGEPAEKSVSATSTIWFYPDIKGGHVIFDGGRVHSWKVP